MARKRALVVDDSKSARVILSRMLEKYDIEVDMAESAEQAIDYLNHHRPDAIFMDHLMPGMDGLQALKAIKDNPQTATIPIMMYTSQEGELYVGQARALGAMGVLPKQVRPVDVSKVLYELHLLADRRDRDEPVLAPVELERERAGAPELVPKSGAVEWGSRVEALVRDQGADMRRFIVASMDSFAARIIGDLRTALPPARSAGDGLPPVIAPPPRSKLLWPALCIAAGCCAILFAIYGMLARGELAKARADSAALSAANAELTRTRQELADTVKDLSNALAAGPGPGPAPAPAPASPASSNLPPARVESVPYGEMPLDRSRLDVLRELLSKLEAQGAHGVVRITSYAGLFCLSGNATDGYLPANASLLLGKCDLIGNPSEDSSFAQQRQSLAFANLIAGIRQRTSGAISVAIDASSNARPAAAYPQRSETLTAGDWNKAAAANNRVEFTFEPTAP
ncbi:MAG: response regulator [Steroidobacterales bacterium]